MKISVPEDPKIKKHLCLGHTVTRGIWGFRGVSSGRGHPISRAPRRLRHQGVGAHPQTPAEPQTIHMTLPTLPPKSLRPPHDPDPSDLDPSSNPRPELRLVDPQNPHDHDSTPPFGFDIAEGGGIDLISHIITRCLKIPCAVLMGANIASEVAEEKFCETTIGCRDVMLAPMMRDIIQTEYFRVVVVDDEDAVEICGALKNIVAVGAGFVDGLGFGDNTKAAVIRLGLMEMIKFVDVFYPGSKLSTFFESCGVADLVTTCYGGRNRRVAEAFVKTGRSIKELEDEMLNGQKLQGPITAEEVNYMLANKNMENKFPLFTAVYRICRGELKPNDFIDCIRSHPEHIVTGFGDGEILRGPQAQNWRVPLEVFQADGISPRGKSPLRMESLLDHSNLRGSCAIINIAPSMMLGVPPDRCVLVQCIL
ncbi:hypothetical protein evm_001183 [Chilo suppressalis]|nr:hypothetical protein evm_001183 [Chilo suppressalis]